MTPQQSLEARLRDAFAAHEETVMTLTDTRQALTGLEERLDRDRRRRRVGVAATVAAAAAAAAATLAVLPGREPVVPTRPGGLEAPVDLRLPALAPPAPAVRVPLAAPQVVAAAGSLLAFDPDGPPRIQLLDPLTGVLRRTVALEVPASARLRQVVPAGLGAAATVVDDGRVTHLLLDQRLAVQERRASTASTDGSLLASDGASKVWALVAPRTLALLGGDGEVLLPFAPRAFVAVHEGFWLAGARELVQVDVRGRETGRLQEPGVRTLLVGGGASSLRDGQWVVATGEDATLLFASRVRLPLARLHGASTASAYDGTRVVVAGEAGMTVLHEDGPGAAQAYGLPASPTSVATSPDRLWVADGTRLTGWSPAATALPFLLPEGVYRAQVDEQAAREAGAVTAELGYAVGDVRLRVTPAGVFLSRNDPTAPTRHVPYCRSATAELLFCQPPNRDQFTASWRMEGDALVVDVLDGGRGSAVDRAILESGPFRRVS